MCWLVSFLSCFYITLAATPTPIAAINMESLHRVAERLDSFMNQPVQALDLWQHYRLLDYDLTQDSTNSNSNSNHNVGKLLPSQRNNILRYQFSFALAKQFKVYYGDEQGTFLAYDDNFVDASYREPRDSGYNSDDPSMQHLYNACVDRATGQPTTCDMQEGSLYIQCIGDCQYVQCPSHAASSVTSDTTKYCRSYEKRTATANDVTTKGFIPRTYSCIDQNGQFTETPGQAIQLSAFVEEDDTESGNANVNFNVNNLNNAFVYTEPRSFTLGNCNFQDGQTPVQRKALTGPYAYCNDNNSNAQQCAGTFTGGYRSRDYDPRVRGWYELVRNTQQPSWSNPYTFFTTLEMGITYGQPMYIREQDKNDPALIRTIFQGVLAVDYPLSGISEFLQQDYGADGANSAKTASDPLIIAIAEDAYPHNLIGISTTRKTANIVRVDDETQLCDPSTATIEDCKAKRVSILQEEDIPGQRLSSFDAIMRRAFQAQADTGFEPELLIPVPPASSSSSTISHVSKSIVYEQDKAANLKWRIVVVFATVDSETDSLQWGNPLMVIVVVLGTIGVIACMAMWIQFYNWRNEKAMIHADWRFTLAFLLGCALINLGSFTALGPNTNGLCMLRMWSFNALFTVALAPLLVKVWRMYELIGKSNGFARKAITNAHAALWTLPIIAAELVLLTIFAILDPPRQTVTLENDGLETVQHITCEQNSNAFAYTQFAFYACLVFAGCVLAYLTRNLDPKFGEAKQLIFAMYNIGFTGVVIVAITALVDLDQSGQLAIKVIGIFWATLFSSSTFVLPRLMQVKQSRRSTRIQGQSGMSGGSSSHRNNVYISGIDFTQAPSTRLQGERRSTFGSTRSSSENTGTNPNFARKSGSSFGITSKIMNELSNLEEVSEAEEASVVERRSLSRIRLSQEVDRTVNLGLVVDATSHHSISLAEKDDSSSTTEDEDDYDKGGPQWAGSPDLNHELNRACRSSPWSGDVSSSSFSIGLEDPQIPPSQEMTTPTVAETKTWNSPAAVRARSRMRSIEDQLRSVHSQMESINEEVPDGGNDPDNECEGQGEEGSGATANTAANSSDCV